MRILAFPCKAERAGKSALVVIPVLDFVRGFFYTWRRPTFVLGFLQFWWIDSTPQHVRLRSHSSNVPQSPN